MKTLGGNDRSDGEHDTMAHAYELWPETLGDRGSDAEGKGRDLVPGSDEPVADLGRLGLLLCFASAVLTLIGVGSALERMFS